MMAERKIGSGQIGEQHDKPARITSTVAHAILAILLCGMGMIYASHTETVIGINDSAGYLYGGIRISEVGIPSYEHPYNEEIAPYFTLNAFRVRRPGDARFYLTYSPGYPLLIAGVRRLLPSWEQGMFFVAPAATVVAALGAYLLGQALCSSRAGLWAALLLLLNPVIISNGTLSFSDVPALACLLIGYALLMRETRAPWAQGGWAGFFLGYACLIRYISVIALVGLLPWVLARQRLKKRWRTWLACAFTIGSLGAATLLYNYHYFGGFLATGYAPQHGWIPYPPFSWQNFVGHSPIGAGGYRSVVETITENLGLVGLITTAVGLAAAPRRVTTSLSLTALLPALAYAFYAWPARGSGSRFIIVPLAILGLFSAIGLDWLLSKLRMNRSAAMAIGLAAIVVSNVLTAQTAFAAVSERRASTAQRIAFATSLAEHTASESVFISRHYGDHLILYGHRAVLAHNLIPTREQGGYREEEFAPGLSAAVSALLGSDIPVYVIDDAVNARAGRFDPLPVLQEHFSLSRCPQYTPPVYRVWPLDIKNPKPETCWGDEGGS